MRSRSRIRKRRIKLILPFFISLLEFNREFREGVILVTLKEQEAKKFIPEVTYERNIRVCARVHMARHAKDNFLISYQRLL